MKNSFSDWPHAPCWRRFPDNPITPEQLAGIPLSLAPLWTWAARQAGRCLPEHALNVEIVAEIDGLLLFMRAVRDGPPYFAARRGDFSHLITTRYA
ncbi:hypothetical protein KCP76_17615 [Salmonella enterica subsp. enterica serovar Weltevreden]|nr:hypothetical protein KCP76_17615 [Salmonella enterica subsp. enterica serovar Weltevreden]